MEAHQPSTPDTQRRHRHEGPRNHIISFVISIVLTAFAFIAVNYRDHVDKAFLLILLVSMAMIQVIVQLAFWMHLKDRGHLHATIFISGGAVVALTAVVTAAYWMWW